LGHLIPGRFGAIEQDDIGRAFAADFVGSSAWLRPAVSRMLMMIDDLVTKPARTNASGSGPNCRRHKDNVKTTVDGGRGQPDIGDAPAAVSSLAACGLLGRLPLGRLEMSNQLTGLAATSAARFDVNQSALMMPGAGADARRSAAGFPGPIS
jgi:hypothetical protein